VPGCRPQSVLLQKQESGSLGQIIGAVGMKSRGIILTFNFFFEFVYCEGLRTPIDHLIGWIHVTPNGPVQRNAMPRDLHEYVYFEMNFQYIP
jgi:hypothetical protein